jgi:hypothetical protein
LKIARAIVDRRISTNRIADLIETAIIRHSLPATHKFHVSNRGGFVCTSIFSELKRNNGKDRR